MTVDPALTVDPAMQVLEERERAHSKQWIDHSGRPVTTFTEYNEAVKGMRFESMKVTLKMQGPIGVTDYLHLDALVWHAALEEQLGMAFWNQTGEENYDLHLPLLTIAHRFHREGLTYRPTGETLLVTKKYFASSVGGYEKGFVEGVTAWRKRCDFPPELGRVDKQRGLFKAYDVPLTYVSAPEVVFYAVGCLGEVERLLKAHISHVGKKRSQGFGYVGDVVVERCTRDWSVLRDGVLQRPIPVEGCPHKFVEPVEAYYAYRPPYWRTGNLCPCFMPGSRLTVSVAKE